MSRKEDFIQAGIDYRMEYGKPMAIGGDNFAEMAKEMNRTKPFEAGAEHGYQYAVDKACEWLQENLYVLRTFKDPRVNKYEIFIRMLRGAMEE